MNTLEIEEVARKDPCLKRFFLGVFSSDQLPNVIQRPACFIANTDPSHRSGQHWVAMYFGMYTEYFDSYGLAPIKPFVERYVVDVYNPYCLQDLDTNVCGEYCVYYLMKRVQGYDMNSIVNYLCRRSECNDSIVKTYIKRLKNCTLPLSICQSCVCRCEYEGC